MRRSFIALSVAALVVLIWPATALANTQPTLLTAGNYAVLAGSTITDTGPSWITGRVGLSPGLAPTGFPPTYPPLTGATFGPLDVGPASPAGQAKIDLGPPLGAYTSATTGANLACTNKTGVDLGSVGTLVAGNYCYSSSAGLTGTLTLSGGGVFIFQIASSLTTASSSVVSLINGAVPCNVFWAIGASATLGTSSAFVGTIMAQTSITMTTRATLLGRALAQTGAVTLDTNRIIVPTGCGYTPAFVAGPVGTTLPATLPNTGVPLELLGEFPWLLVIGVGGGLGAIALSVSSARRRRRTT